MKYYDSNGILREFSVTEPFDSGGNAEVFKIENNTQVLKKYKDPLQQTKWKIDYELFEILKHINNFHFIHLLERYYDYMKYSEDSINCIKEWPEWSLIDAYTYDYVEEDKIDLLTMPIDYLLTNLDEMEKLFFSFAKEGITVGDLTANNVVLNQNGIVIIDPDGFSIRTIRMEDDYSRVLKVNREWLCDLFRSLLNQNHSYEKTFSLFNERKLVGSDNMTSIVAKKLRPYQKTIDYIKAR